MGRPPAYGRRVPPSPDRIRGPRPGSAWRGLLVPPWSGRNFTLVLAARLAMSTGRTLAGVVVPVYLALDGFGAFELAVYVMVVALVSAVLSSAIGLLSDRVGRRVFLVLVPLLCAGAAAGFAVGASTPLLFVLGALGSFGRGSGAGAGTVGPYQPAEAAFVAEAVAGLHRNAAFSRLAFASSLGAMTGGLLALVGSTGHLRGRAGMVADRPLFVVIAVVSVVAAGLALGLVEPAGRSGPDGPARPRVRFPARSRWLLYRLWVTNGVNGMAVGMFGPFITYWFFRRFGAGPGELGLLFAVINAACLASTLSAAGLARRWGTVRTIAVVRTAQALLLVPMALAPSFLVAGAVYLVRMVVQRVGMPLRQSYALAQADPAERASVAALSNLPSQLATAVSPLFAGYLLAEVSLAAPFEVSAVLQLVNAGTFWAFFRDAAPEEERDRTVPVAVGARPARAAAGEGGTGGTPAYPPPSTATRLTDRSEHR